MQVGVSAPSGAGPVLHCSGCQSTLDLKLREFQVPMWQKDILASSALGCSGPLAQCSFRSQMMRAAIHFQRSLSIF